MNQALRFLTSGVAVGIVRKMLIACALVAVIAPEVSLAQGQVDLQDFHSTVSERMSARRAAAAKSLADDIEPGLNASNLLRFYENLETFKYGHITGNALVPAHKQDSVYLKSLEAGLTERPFIWLDDRPLALGDYPAAVPLVGYRVNAGAIQITGVCSGTLIARYVVLTAAHCVCDLGEKMRAFLNTPDYRKDAGIRVEVVASKSRIPNCQDYLSANLDEQREILRTNGDVAVLFLDQEAAKVNITPAVLVDAFKPSSSYYIVGYGISDDDPSPGVRRLATIQGMACSGSAPKKYGCNSAFEFWGDGRQITGRTDRPDSCGGDSGGAVFSTETNSPPQLIGVISRPITGTTCGQGGVYVLLTPPILTWVEELRKLGAGSFPPA